MTTILLVIIIVLLCCILFQLPPSKAALRDRLETQRWRDENREKRRQRKEENKERRRQKWAAFLQWLSRFLKPLGRWLPAQPAVTVMLWVCFFAIFAALAVGLAERVVLH